MQGNFFDKHVSVHKICATPSPASFDVKDSNPTHVSQSNECTYLKESISKNYNNDATIPMTIITTILNQPYRVIY